MTTKEIASVFHAKRIKKGRYVALCMVHGDRHPSLEIAEGKDGRTLILCRSNGCELKDILATAGLRMCDLFADSKPDKKKLREIERIRAAEERERRKAKERLWRLADQVMAQRKIVCDIGKALSWDGSNRRLCERFHYALEKYRTLDQAVVDGMVRLYGFKPDYFVVGDL